MAKIRIHPQDAYGESIQGATVTITKVLRVGLDGWAVDHLSGDYEAVISAPGYKDERRTWHFKDAGDVLVGLDADHHQPPATTGDAIDLTRAVMTPALGDRALTATITHLTLMPNGVSVAFTKKDGPDRWPDVIPEGWAGPVQYTLWIGAELGDGWHVAASVMAWHELDPFGGPVSDPAHYPQDLWYLDPALKAYAPKVGDRLAFFVTAGGDRAINAHQVFERSNVVVVPMPGPEGATYAFE